MFGQLAFDARLLESRKIFDEYLALQMVHLVLNAHRQQIISLQLKRSAIQAEGAHPHPGAAGDGFVNARYRQTAFFAFALAVTRENFGIDESHQPGFVLRDIDDDQLDVPINLGRSQSDTGRGIHGLGQVGGETADRVIDLFDFDCLGVQAWIWITNDGKSSHKAKLKNIAEKLLLN